MLSSSGKICTRIRKTLIKKAVGILPLKFGVVALSGSLAVVGLLEIELENSGGEEVQEYVFILSFHTFLLNWSRIQ